MRICQPRSRLQEFLYCVRWQLGGMLLSLPSHVAFVVRGLAHPTCGCWKRARLALNLLWVHLRVSCAHSPAELLAVVEEILLLPPEVPGVIVECGCYQGGSSAKLSLAAGMANRPLIVCDSFQGLPQPETSDHLEKMEAFQRGDFATRLEEVETNVRHYGNPAVVQFVPGWYQESLKRLSGVPIACLFLDVDLQESIKSCLMGLWKSVAPGCKVFVHDVDRSPVVKPFRDKEWWSNHIDSTLPEFVGSGRGLGWQKRLLGYAVKS
jgi:O-methyltransferase